MSLFSERLKWLREKKGYTQKQMGEILGMSGPSYSKYEYGLREPNINTLYKIRNILDEPLDFLIGYMHEDLIGGNIFELYSEARRTKEEAIEKIENINEYLNQSKDNLDDKLKSLLTYKEELRSMTKKEEYFLDSLYDHLLTIPGIEGELATKEYWIKKYELEKEEEDKIFRAFWEDFKNT